MTAPAIPPDAPEEARTVDLGSCEGCGRPFLPNERAHVTADDIELCSECLPDAPEELRARAAKLIASELRYQLGYTPAGADVVADHLVPALAEAGLLARSERTKGAPGDWMSLARDLVDAVQTGRAMAGKTPEPSDAALLCDLVVTTFNTHGAVVLWDDARLIRENEEALGLLKAAAGDLEEAANILSRGPNDEIGVTAAMIRAFLSRSNSRPGLLARSEGEAVEALRRQCADDVGQALTRAGIAEDQRDRLRGELKEAVGLLRELLDGYGCQPGYISRLGTQRIEAFLSRSESRPGPDRDAAFRAGEKALLAAKGFEDFTAFGSERDAVHVIVTAALDAYEGARPGPDAPSYGEMAEFVRYMVAGGSYDDPRDIERRVVALAARLPGAQEPEKT